MKILITGFSTRAMAGSARRAGVPFLTIDYFGDYDQKLCAENYSLLRDGPAEFSPAGLLEASKRFRFDGLVYTANLDNHPEVVSQFAADHPVLGNSHATLEAVRDWRRLERSLGRAGIRAPALLFAVPEYPANGKKWLVKPEKSGGGRKVRFWFPGQPLEEGFYLQEFKPGISCSASFIADGKNCLVIGLSEQLAGVPEFGAEGFCYAGNIFPLHFPGGNGQKRLAGVLERVNSIAALLTLEFSLKGLNGMDFIVDGENEVHLLEVNPRYSGSMELIEQSLGVNLFRLHLAAVRGQLPAFVPDPQQGKKLFYGKAIIYAEADAVMPDTRSWPEKGVRDVPFPGDAIAGGQPVCTVFAVGNSRDECFRKLRQQARSLKKLIYRRDKRDKGGRPEVGS